VKLFTHGKAKQIFGRWIDACYRERKRLPTRYFEIEMNNESESEDEIHELIEPCFKQEYESAAEMTETKLNNFVMPLRLKFSNDGDDEESTSISEE
jgi:hypothetical protein